MRNIVVRFTLIGLIGSSLVGCAAAQVKIAKGKLDVQTKMSATLFVDTPETEAQKTIYLQANNSSDKEFEILSNLRQAFAGKGYRIASNVNQAQFVVQVNVLQVGKFAPTAAEAAMYRGYGTAGDMMAHTAYVGGALDANPIGADKIFAGAGLLGDLASMVTDSAVKDVYFSVVTDVQIKERLAKGVKAEQTSLHFNRSGTSGDTVSRVDEKSDWKISQTRILSSANKVNLDFDTAAPELKKALVNSVASVF